MFSFHERDESRFFFFKRNAADAFGVMEFASHPHHNIYHFDKIVTYILLVGAAALDMVGVFKLVFSDWVIVSAKEKVARVLIRLRTLGRREQRWSDFIAQHSFISFCLKEEQRFRWLNKIAVFLRMKEVMRREGKGVGFQ
ncbi:hypothetical protein C2S52_009808 [Perilla frutescens var. hirtella]|nr:hypothetical protein C2S52_009808 [Perilla frutescens var. hirtella]